MLALGMEGCPWASRAAREGAGGGSWSVPLGASPGMAAGSVSVPRKVLVTPPGCFPHTGSDTAKDVEH